MYKLTTTVLVSYIYTTSMINAAHLYLFMWPSECMWLNGCECVYASVAVLMMVFRDKIVLCRMCDYIDWHSYRFLLQNRLIMYTILTNWNGWRWVWCCCLLLLLLATVTDYASPRLPIKMYKVLCLLLLIFLCS